MFEGKIKVLEIEKIDHPKIAGITTIYLQDIGKISGIKIVHINGEVKCEPPNRSFVDNGIRKWQNVFSFERDLWDKIQEKIVKEWQKCR
ncbi:MAG TPA: hypothetical protein VNN20_06145 [Thermodesulfobacteriota bacterium]|nr:hypothetical protein [Thermodesulfobacteriota bacterium]